MAKPEKRKEARKLRREGWAIHEIAKELNTHKDVIIGWCNDIELSDAQKESLSQKSKQWAAQNKGAQINKDKALIKRVEYQEEGREKARESNFLHLLGSILYWGEGAKARKYMSLINTDPFLLKLFMRFLREELLVDDKDVVLKIFHHTDDDMEILRIKDYWLDWLRLPQTTKISMTLKIGTSSRKARYINGICTIVVYRTEVVQHIYGAIQEYAGFENPKWVG